MWATPGPYACFILLLNWCKQCRKYFNNDFWVHVRYERLKRYMDLSYLRCDCWISVVFWQCRCSERFEMDERFADLLTNPKFRGIRKQDRKVKVDERFQSLIKSTKSRSHCRIDKRGRPLQASKNDLHQYVLIFKFWYLAI